LLGFFSVAIAVVVSATNSPVFVVGVRVYVAIAIVVLIEADFIVVVVLQS
jgi:hypothetical protein